MTQDTYVNGKKSENDNSRKPEREKNVQTKVVIRRLPSTMTEDQFLDQISPLPDNDYLHFVKADLSLGINSFSRAYINFLNQDDIFTFKDKFDGYVFLDTKGNEYPAVVEFAPFQKIPKKRSKRRDPKCGTLDQDPEYLKFLENIDNPDEDTGLPSAESYLEELEAKEKEFKENGGPNKSTPLIEFIKQRKMDQIKMREQKREDRKKRDLDRKRVRDEEKRKRKPEKKSISEGAESMKETVQTFKKDGHYSGEEGLKLTLLKNPESSSASIKSSSGSTSNHGSSFSQGNTREQQRKETYREVKGEREKGLARREKERNRERPTNLRDKDACRVREPKDREEKRPSKTLDHNKNAPSTKSFSGNSKKSADVTGTSLISEDPAVLAAAIEKPAKTTPSNRGKRQNVKSESDHHGDSGSSYREGKDPRTERRIRNKDRPAMEIYRPGMRRMSAPRSSSTKESLSAGNSGSSSPAHSPNLDVERKPEDYRPEQKDQ